MITFVPRDAERIRVRCGPCRCVSVDDFDWARRVALKMELASDDAADVTAYQSCRMRELSAIHARLNRLLALAS